MTDKQKRNRRKNWMQNIYQLGTLASLIFIMVQAYYARRSNLQSSEWEKAKITIQNIEQFKESLISSPLSKEEVWIKGDGLWADLSTPEGWQLSDTLRKIYLSLFDNETDAREEFYRMVEIMDAYAYPIIMGYASEIGSLQSTMRQYYTCGNLIMSELFHNYKLIGIHAKLLYRLWRIRVEILAVDNIIISGDSGFDEIRERKDHLLCYEETDVSEALLKAYRKKLEKKLKEMQKVIEVFRKNNLR